MLEKIAAAAKEAGKIITAERNAKVYRKEGHYNFVTEADLKVQELLRTLLCAVCPEADFYAEEQENAVLTVRPTWVVDPIDGTLNFMRSRDCSAVSIALLYDRQPVYGAVYLPFQDELFTAQRGKGARMNGQPVSVSQMPFENAMVALGTSPYNSALAKETLKRAERFLLEGGDLRRTGSAAKDLCDVACGRSDVFFELQLSPWDIAAGSLIVEEAGGVFSEYLEAERTFDKKVAILACNKACYPKALEILKQKL